VGGWEDGGQWRRSGSGGGKLRYRGVGMQYAIGAAAADGMICFRTIILYKSACGGPRGVGARDDWKLSSPRHGGC
jgi:hypothetical protein